MPFIFPVVIIVLSTLLFFVHLVVYKGVISIFGLSSPVIIICLKVFLIVFGGGFIVAMMLAFRWNNIYTRLLYTSTASWYGFLFYLFLAVVLYTLLVAVFGTVMSSVSIMWVGRIAVCLALCIGLYGLWNMERIQITQYDVSIQNMPNEWHGKRAVWVSDIHLGQVFGKNFSEKIVTAINAQNPDIVFIGGDLYDGPKVDEKDVISPFSHVNSKQGTYFITGNHEEFGDSTHFIEAIKNVGVTVLHNEMITINGLNIIGVNDRDSNNRVIFENILSGIHIDPSTPTLLLKHEPNNLDIAEKFSISMQVSGHTHRAQLYPLSFITRWMYKGYDYGYKQYGTMQVYTSSGVGTWGPPQRVGTKSEIVVFNFR